MIVIIALHLTEYGTRSSDTDGHNDYTVEIRTLLQHDLTEDAVKEGLHALVAEHLLSWQGEPSVLLTSVQMKHLTRYYRDE